MRCSSCEPLLDAYLEGTLRPREARAVAAHVRACGDCAALLRELRIIDALLTTARAPNVAPDFTATVVSAVRATQPRTPRRRPVAAALLLYLAIAWAMAALAAVRAHAFSTLTGRFVTLADRDVTALTAAARALAPATPLAAAAVTAVLLLDLLLFGVIFYAYHRVRPLLVLHLSRVRRS